MHISDNSKQNDPENKRNKLYKIQPVLDHVRDNCACMISSCMQAQSKINSVPSHMLVVFKLLEKLQKKPTLQGFYDNWFSSIPLTLALKESGYLATATLRADRTKACPLPAKKGLEKKG